MVFCGLSENFGFFENSKRGLQDSPELQLSESLSILNASFLWPRFFDRTDCCGLDSFRAEVDPFREELGLFRAEVDPFRAEMFSFRAEVDPFRAEMVSFRVLVDSFRDKLDLFRAEVDPFRLDTCEISIFTEASTTLERND